MKNPVNKMRLAIMASGRGSNAVNFMEYFGSHQRIEVALVVSNNPAAGVLDRAAEHGVGSRVLTAGDWGRKTEVLAFFADYAVDAIVLAGYMRLIPEWLIKKFPNRIFNIHPALLPDFGGKGMYGIHVHRAVIQSGVKRTGITIHLVNERYDEGPVLFQESIPVYPEDTPESLAVRVQRLEHLYYPRVVEEQLLGERGSKNEK